MALSPEMMALQQGQQPPQAAAAPAPAPSPSTPASAPMSTPQANEGEMQAARAEVQIASKVLDSALMKFGSDTEEGRVILEVLTKISRKFGREQDKSASLIPAEIMNLVSSMPRGAGGVMPQPKVAAPPPQPGMQ